MAAWSEDEEDLYAFHNDYLVTITPPTKCFG